MKKVKTNEEHAAAMKAVDARYKKLSAIEKKYKSIDNKKLKKDFNKKLAKKLKERFGGIKVKNVGDGMMEISFD